jgi:ABC-2 type transport system ATP-binding protein
MSFLTVRGAGRQFGPRCRRRTALWDCTFEVEPGEVIGVVGPNGAGKTTLLRLLAGEIQLTTGSITVAGHPAGTRPARRLVGFAPDPPVAPPQLAGTEWLRVLARHRSRSEAERTRLVGSAIETAELHEFVRRRVAGYSRGMVQRLALAAAVICGTRVVVLDETLSGIDPLAHRRLRERLLRLAESGRSIVIASHDLSAVERLATRALVLAGGRLRADVPMATLASERVAELTLGGAALAGVDQLLARYPGSLRTGYGVAIPLTCGITVEQILGTMRQERVAVAASRVRYRALEDILVAAIDRNQGRL